jgi:hypothetical protein
MKDDLNERLIASAERMVDYHDRLFEIFQRIGNESKSRLVWIVAIAGFAIINSPTVLAAGDLQWAKPVLPAAWALTAVFTAITHWQFRNRSIAEIRIYTTKREYLLAYITNGPQSATMADLNDILTNKKDSLPKLFQAQLAVTTFADRLELLTMILFVLSMGLTIGEYLLP